DPNVDGVIVIYTPQPALESMGLAEKIVEKAGKKVKPILTVWMGGAENDPARRLFYENEIPTYPTPEKAVRTYMYMYRYKRNLELLYETPEELPMDLSPPKNHLKLIIRRAVKEGRTTLTEEEADKFLDAYRIPRAPAYLAKSLDEALEHVSRVGGYPVALKIVSPDITHKTDIGGVVLGVDSEKRLREEYARLLERVKRASPKARIDGVYVQKMMQEIDFELILGARRDKDFGMVVLFGRGGRGVEHIHDFSMGLPPLNQTLARRMMEETKIYGALSRGLRSEQPINLRALEEIVVLFSNMVSDFPEMSEVEVNPLAASRTMVQALDSRIIIDPEAVKERNSYPHLVILPYPTKYVTPWRLRDGTEVILRPIRPEDERLESEFIMNLSDETKRFRFFRVIKELSHADLVRFCNIDYDREMAIIAELREDGKRKEIGAARLILEPGGAKGEIAVVVADEYQRKGLGTKLVDMLIEIAEEKGLESIYGIIMPKNESVINLFRKMGFTFKAREDEVIAILSLK
ncbi:MAG: GNAT family N-acetyltransferase, partial [Candidatus Bathyarchaeia archaeon]